MALIQCKRCGKGAIGLVRGRRRKFCSDACRLASHRVAKGTRRRGAVVSEASASPPAPAAEPGGLEAWAEWARVEYAIDRTGEEILRLILEADRRYVQARDVLNAQGITQTGGDGRAIARPEVAVERDTRAAMQRLIVQLGLEDDDDANTQAPRGTTARFPSRVAG